MLAGGSEQRLLTERIRILHALVGYVRSCKEGPNYALRTRGDIHTQGALVRTQATLREVANATHGEHCHLNGRIPCGRAERGRDPRGTSDEFGVRAPLWDWGPCEAD